MSLLLKLRQHLLTGLLGSPSSLEHVSDRSYELCAAERQVVLPALFLQRDLDRVTGVEEFTTIEQEMRRVGGGEQVNEATIAYEVSNVTLRKGFLFKAGWKHRLLENAPSVYSPKEPRAHGTVTSTFFGSRYFGHWMSDDLTLGMAAECTGDPFTPERKEYGHERAYESIFGLPHRVFSCAGFEKLTILKDFGQNSYKKKRYQEMRRRLMAKVRPTAGRRIYLDRGGCGSVRVLENVEEIKELLVRLGFSLLEPAKLTAQEVIEQCAGAEIVMGIEGSQLGHALYTIADHGVLCALQPPFRMNNIFKGQADCIGFRYAFITGIASPRGFRIELDEMRELVDRLAGVVAARVPFPLVESPASSKSSNSNITRAAFVPVGQRSATLDVTGASPSLPGRDTWRL